MPWKKLQERAREREKGPAYSIITILPHEIHWSIPEAGSLRRNQISLSPASQSYWSLSLQYMIYGGHDQATARGTVMFTMLSLCLFPRILLENHLFNTSCLFRRTHFSDTGLLESCTISFYSGSRHLFALEETLFPSLLDCRLAL